MFIAALTCLGQVPIGDAPRGYTDALLREAALEDGLRSLRAVALYAGRAGLPAKDAWETYRKESETLARLREELQVNEPRPNLETMHLAALSELAGSALLRVKRASLGRGTRPAFLPLPVLTTADRKDLMHRLAFGALAPTVQHQTPATLELLRQLGIQFLSPPHRYFSADPKSSDATDPKQVLSHAARFDAAGLGLSVWLQPDANIGQLWPEIGAAMYLHDAKGRWQNRNRINNNLNVFHPGVREEACAWLQRFAGAQRGDTRIIGYELVEEPALRFDVSPADSAAVEPAYGDYTEASKSAFRKRLAQKYGRIEEVNRLWGSRYSSFDEVEPPSELQRKTPWQRPELPLLVEFQEFRAAGHAEYFRLMIDTLHRANPGVPVLPKFTAKLFGDPLGGVDLSRMSEAGWDAFSYHTDTCFPYIYSLARYRKLPSWNGEFIWTASGSAPATSAVRGFLTPRSEGEFRLRAHAAIALWQNLMWGARGFVLFNTDFTWNHPKDGGDWNNELLNGRLDNRVPRYAAAVFPQILPKVSTFEKELFDSVVENEGLYIVEPTTSLYAATPTGSPVYWGMRIVDRLSRESFHPAVAPERYIANGEENLSGARVVVVPWSPYMPEAVFRKLRAWNAAGGTLITFGPFATHDEFGNERADFTLAAGTRHIVIPMTGEVDARIAAAESAVRTALGERPVSTDGAPLEWMLRHISATEDLLVVLNADPQRQISAGVTPRRKYMRITDLTVEGGAAAPAAGPIPLRLDPGEARVFLLEAGRS